MIRIESKVENERISVATVFDDSNSLLEVTMNFAVVWHGTLRDFLNVLDYAEKWTDLRLIYRTKSFQPLIIVRKEASKNVVEEKTA